jgi:hypothetical protein
MLSRLIPKQTRANVMILRCFTTAPKITDSKSQQPQDTHLYDTEILALQNADLEWDEGCFEIPSNPDLKNGDNKVEPASSKDMSKKLPSA